MEFQTTALALSQRSMRRRTCSQYKQQTGKPFSYNPGILKAQTDRSTVYRREERDIAVGDRIQFTASDTERGTRLGSFATVESMGKDSTLTVRTDGGKVIELDEEKSRHIDHGYTVASARYLAADRVILTGGGHPACRTASRTHPAFTRH